MKTNQLNRFDFLIWGCYIQAFQVQIRRQNSVQNPTSNSKSRKLNHLDACRQDSSGTEQRQEHPFVQPSIINQAWYFSPPFPTCSLSLHFFSTIWNVDPKHFLPVTSPFHLFPFILCYSILANLHQSVNAAPPHDTVVLWPRMGVWTHFCPLNETLQYISADKLMSGSETFRWESETRTLCLEHKHKSTGVDIWKRR